jgi:dTMP kinase
MPGRFIVLEGLDGSGTTSQAAALAASLEARGHAVHQTREPSDGVIGRQIRELLRADRSPRVDPHAIALLFAADRLAHVRDEIQPALERGEVVVCDRYVVSSWVYQSLECDAAWVRMINARAPWPDLTVMLDVPVDVAIARVHARAGVTEIYDTEATQRRVAAAYRQVATEGHPNVVVVDGTGTIDDVAARVQSSAIEYLTTRRC